MLSNDVKKILEVLEGMGLTQTAMLGVLQQMASVQTAMAADVAEIKKAVVEPPPDTTPVGTVVEPGIPVERP